ncbi:hypothetical protein V6N13_043505 [Hibiscus sabdariffa]
MGPLYLHVCTHLQGSLPRVSVADMATPSGDWNWNLFDYLLPRQVLLQIATVKGPCPLVVYCSFGWQGSQDLSFSVKSAYQPDRFPMRSTDWSLMFGSIIWFLWLDRNAKVFGAADVTVGSVVQNSHRLVLLASHVVGSRMIAMQAGAGSTRDPVL